MIDSADAPTYDPPVSIGRQEFELVRQKPAYRAAIWIARALLLLAVPLLILQLTGALDAVPAAVVAALWAMCCALVIAEWILFHRAGVPLLAGDRPGGEGVPLRRTLYLDTLGVNRTPRPRP